MRQIGLDYADAGPGELWMWLTCKNNGQISDLIQKWLADKGLGN
jgi:hypothetical protein